MRTIKTLVLTFALMLTGYAYATADTQATNDQAKATAKAACCDDQTACTKEGAACCAEGAACCKEGAACCAEGAACCNQGATCCADKQAADKVTAKAHSNAEQGGCCAAGSCKMMASAK